MLWRIYGREKKRCYSFSCDSTCSLRLPFPYFTEAQEGRDFGVGGHSSTSCSLDLSFNTALISQVCQENKRQWMVASFPSRSLQV